MWRFLTALRNREPRLSAPRAKKSQARKRPATCRPRLELLEDRLVLDVGDSFGSALLTGLGPTVGSYTMPSEYIGDGRFKNLDVDLYQFTGKSGELIKAVTSPPATGNAVNTYLWLFDSTGNRLAFDYDHPYSSVKYQLIADGTYYVGISGAGNYYYNPNLAGSGNAASSTGNYRLDLTLFLPFADAAGDTLATAQETGLGPADATVSVASAQIGDGLYLNKDVDLYKIQAGPNQALTATVGLPTGGSALTGDLRVFDANGKELYNNYWNNSSGPQIVTKDLLLPNSGIYYVGLSGYPNSSYDPTIGGSGYSAYYTGDYSLDLGLRTLTPDAAGDTLTTAQVTTLNKADDTYSVPSARIGDGLYVNKDVDLYKIQVNAGQALTATIGLPNGGSALTGYLRIFDAAGNQLSISYWYNYYGAQVVANNFQFKNAGVYYIGLSGYPNSNYDPNVGGSGTSYYNYFYTGDYSLDLKLVTPTPDSAGDTLNDAQVTALGSTTNSYVVASTQIGDGLYLGKDVDLYKFQGIAGQGLTATTAQPTGGQSMYTVLRLFDKNGKQLAIDTQGNGAYSRLAYIFGSTDTYYIGVSGYYNVSYDPTIGGSGTSTYYTGDYSLDLELATPVFDNVGDSLTTALATGMTEANGPYTMTGAAIGDGFYGKKDVDLYRFDATAGQFLSVATSPPAGGSTLYNPTLRLFDAAGKELANTYYSYYTASITDFKIPATGTYYVGVAAASNFYYDPNVAGSGTNAYSTGAYNLKMSLVTPTPDAAGDTLTTAQLTTLTGVDGSYSVAAHIGDGLYRNKDVDLYQIQATAGQSLKVTIGLPAGGSALSGYVRIFDVNGNQLKYNYYWYNYYGSQVVIQDFRFDTTGTYYVGLSGYPNYNYNPNIGGSGTSYYGTFYTGDYSLTMALSTPPPDVGDTLLTAQVTTLGPTASTYSVANGRIGDGPYTYRDVDLYQFQAATAEQLTVTVGLPANGSGLYGVVRIFDVDGTQLYSNSWNNFNGSQVVTQDFMLRKAGTYYIGVSGYPNYYYDPKVGGSGYGYYSGDYTLGLTLKDAPAADSIGDTLATALATGLGSTSTSYAMPSAQIGDGTWRSFDVDMFQFTAVAGQKIAAITSLPAGSTNPMYTMMRLFDANGKELATSFEDLPNGYSEIDYLFTAPGTYYIGISGAYNYNYDPTVAGSGTYYVWSTGDYRLDMTLSIPVNDNVGDTLGTALVTSLGTNGKKAFNFSQATIGDGAYGSHDVDLYQFTAQAGQTFTAATTLPNSSTLYDPILRLFDANGNELASGDGVYGGLAYLFDTAGTYYLGVSGSYNSSYDPNVAGSGRNATTGDYSLDLNLIDPKKTKDQQVVTPSVRGHGTIDYSTTGPQNAAKQLDSVTVRAWLDGNGTAHGTVVWTWSHNTPPTPDNPHNNGYPWYLKVDTLVFYGNTAYIEAVVVRSPQSPGDVGTRVAFWVTDNGNGKYGQDMLNWQPIKGNFTVQS